MFTSFVIGDAIGSNDDAIVALDYVVDFTIYFITYLDNTMVHKLDSSELFKWFN